MLAEAPVVFPPASLSFHGGCGSRYQVLKRWAGRTQTGDRAELADLPEDLGLWKEICASSESCLGQACDFSEDCFITRMRQEAAGADVVIVNHHLFFADLAVRLRGYGEVLPRYEAVIFDEAHQIGRGRHPVFGGGGEQFPLRGPGEGHPPGGDRGKVKGPVLGTRSPPSCWTGRSGSSTLSGAGIPRFRLQEKHLAGEPRESRGRLAGCLTLLSSHVEGMKDPAEELRALSRRAEELKRQFGEILDLSNRKRVYWCEVRGRGVFLHASPVDVSSHLQEHLYPRMKTAVFTSATLSTRENFRFFKGRMGLEGEWGETTDEKILDSSFDMKTQSLLYLPAHLPDPNQPAFLPRAVEEIGKILELTRGRAFLLFTSIKNMEEAYRSLKAGCLSPVSCKANVRRLR